MRIKAGIMTGIMALTTPGIGLQAAFFNETTSPAEEQLYATVEGIEFYQRRQRYRHTNGDDR
jgi:hypothetical protein